MNEFGKYGLRMSIEAERMEGGTVLKMVGEPLFVGEVEGIGQRGFVRVHNLARSYWADNVTGTLYRDDLQCLSSDRLRLLAVPVPAKKRSPKPKPVSIYSYN